MVRVLPEVDSNDTGAEKLASNGFIPVLIATSTVRAPSDSFLSLIRTTYIASLRALPD